MITPSPNPPESIIISYLTMRKVIGFLGVLLVPVLIVGSLLLDAPRQIKESVSAYYYSHMGNVLVGTLCGISLFLFSYHGNSRQDSVTSKLAGFFALGIAFFPTSPTTDKTDISSVIHYASAGIFFCCYLTCHFFSLQKFTERIQ